MTESSGFNVNYLQQLYKKEISSLIHKKIWDSQHIISQAFLSHLSESDRVISNANIHGRNQSAK